MTQDTRKDPRAKVLSMTVRYKSATLDEFIEHHSHDVSRGGMFIKTPSPFPPGTLLKFEVKLADEKRVMQGVGRVVWKREVAESTESRPAGMGVKFIKIDEESRRTIDRLVAARSTDSNAFDQGTAGRVSSTPAAPGPSATPAPPAARRTSPHKATVIGLGAMIPPSSPAPAPSEPKASAPKPSGPVSPPKLSGDSEPPFEDRTLMRQASELLADVVRQAGSPSEPTPASKRPSPSPVPRPEPGRSLSPKSVPASKGGPASKGSASAPSPGSTSSKAPLRDLERPAPMRLDMESGEDPEAQTTIWKAAEAAALLAAAARDSVPPPEGEGERPTHRPKAAPAESDAGAKASSNAESSEANGAPGKEGGERDSQITVRPPAAEAKAPAEHAEDSSAEKEAAPAAPAPAARDEKPEAKAESPAATTSSATEETAKRRAPTKARRETTRAEKSAVPSQAAEETSSGGGGKVLFLAVALAAAAGIAFYATRPAPEPPAEPTVAREPIQPAAPVEPTPAAVEPAAPSETMEAVP
ncbi:MAG: TIGR02266 family protein, partial [Pseudomonadota bacterium]